MTRAAGPRVVVSGMGVVSALGWGLPPFVAGVERGESAIGRFERFDSSAYPTHVAGEVPTDVAGRAARPHGRGRRFSYADRFAVSAAVEAVAAARLPADLGALDAGVFFGCSTSGMSETERFYERWRERPLSRAPRWLLDGQPLNRPAEAVARRFGATGPVETVASACASSTLALGLALDALREGLVRVALAGGADSLCRTTFGGFNALRSVDPRPCRPFQADRSGLSLGEGGAVLVLERLDDALARGVTPVAELAGAGSSSDAHHMTAPEPDGRGAALALERALRDAHLAPAEIDLINAHGSATPLNDVAEFRALEQVFGPRARTVPLIATKATVGHLLGGAGAIEAVATVVALRDRRLQPVPGGGSVDPAAPVALVTRAQTADLQAAVSLNLGFGGCNAAVVLRRWDGV